MDQHADKIAAALHRLASKEPVWPFTGSCMRALALVGAHADFRAIRVIARFASSSLQPVRLAAWEAIDRLLRATAPEHLPALDSGMRSYGYGSGAWTALQPDAVARLALAPQAPSLLGVASMHENGHVREAAVRQLAGRTEGAELPFLLLRTADWVEPVRAAAAEAVRARLVPRHAAVLWSCAALIARLDARVRADRTWLAPCCDLLFRDECRDATRAACAGPDRHGARRGIYKVASRTGSPVAGAAVQAALADCDHATRAWACSWLLFRLEHDAAVAAAGRAAADRSATVRRAGLRALAELDPRSANALLSEALFDPRPSLRAVARFYLASWGVRVRPYYVSALFAADPRRLPGALGGIGETGEATDADRASVHLTSPSPRVRAAAARAVGRLDPTSHLASLVELLSDTSAAVSRAAADALRDSAPEVPRDAILAALQPSRPRHVRRNALRIVERLGKWDRLVNLLRLCRDADQELARVAHGKLLGWVAAFNRVPQLPVPELARDASALLAEAAPALPAPLVAELGSILRSTAKLGPDAR